MGLNDKLPAHALDGERIDLTEVPERRAPVGPRTRRRKFQAVYCPDVLEQIQRHGQEATEVEICGVLIGNVYRDAGGPWLHVESSIRGDSAEGRETLRRYAARFGLVMTGSSDYHGDGKPNRLAEHTTSPEALEAIVARTRGVAPVRS